MRRFLGAIRNAFVEEVTAEGLRQYHAGHMRRIRPRLILLVLGSLAHGVLYTWWSAAVILCAVGGAELLEASASRRLLERPIDPERLPALWRGALLRAASYAAAWSMAVVLIWTRDSDPARFLALVVALGITIDAGFLYATNRVATLLKVAAYAATLLALFAAEVAVAGWSRALGAEAVALVLLSYFSLMFVGDVRGARRQQMAANAGLAERGAVLERALAELHRKESAVRRLALAAEHAGDSIVITDAEDRIEWVNHGFTARTGLTLADVGDRPGRLAADPANDPATLKALHDAIDARLPFRSRLRLWCRGDRWVWYDVSLTPLFDEAGRFVNYVSVERDVSEEVAREAELARSRAEAHRLALVAEHARDMIVIYSAEGVIEWVNPAFTARTGYGAQEAVGRPIGSFTVDGIDQSAVLETQAMMEAGRALRAEIVSRRKDGGSFWCDASLSPVCDGAGRVVNWISVERDISDLKAREAELARVNAENQRLALVTRHATDSIMLADAEGRVEWVNDSFTAESGWTLEDVLGRHVRSFVAPECDPASLKDLRRTVEAEGVFRAQLPVVRPYGSPWHDVISTPIHEDGVLRHWVIVERDITEKKAREAELAEKNKENRRLALMTRHAGDCILLSDAQGAIEWVNAAFTAATGLTTEDVAGRRLASFAAPDCPPDQLAAIQAATRMRQSFRTQLKTLRRGESVWHDVRQTPILDEDGTLVHWINVERDISGLKAREAELAEARCAAEAAAEVKSNFLATMSHEIRTPMNGIIGTADLLGESALDEDQTRLLRTIALSSEALLRILDDILDLSKLEADRMEIEAVPFEPAELADLCAQLMRPLANRKGLALAVKLDPTADVALRGDPGRLRQILLNLLGNAIKFTETGRVALTVEVGEAGPEARRLTLAVSDTGIGIEPDRLGGVFDAFTQADGTITRRFGGTGLGLSISRRLAEAMGGSLTARSTPGEGSEFTLAVVLPLAPGAAPAMTVIEGSADAVPTAPLGTLAVVGPAADGSREGPLVLVVEDNATNRFLVERMLTPSGIRCAHAEDGAAGVEACTRLDPDAVVMDMSMPVMDGIEATRRIREAERRAGRAPRPVLALTANAREEDHRRGAEAGVSLFLQKPIRKAELQEAVSQALARHGDADLRAVP